MVTYSYNGWTASSNSADLGGLDNRVVPGTAGVRLAPGVRAGDVAVVLFHVAAQMHARVEPGELYAAGDEWGYSYRQNRNANNLSCHSSGTAFDWNATRHPNGKRGTFTPAQVAEINRILDEVDGVVGWGGGWTAASTPDEMHFEIQATPAAVKAVADKIRAGQLLTIPPIPVPTPRYPQEDAMYVKCQPDKTRPEVWTGIWCGPPLVKLATPGEVASGESAIKAGATVQWVELATWQVMAAAGPVR